MAGRRTDVEGPNPKSEVRSTKQITSTKGEITKTGAPQWALSIRSLLESQIRNPKFEARNKSQARSTK